MLLLFLKTCRIRNLGFILSSCSCVHLIIKTPTATVGDFRCNGFSFLPSFTLASRIHGFSHRFTGVSLWEPTIWHYNISRWVLGIVTYLLISPRWRSLMSWCCSCHDLIILQRILISTTFIMVSRLLNQHHITHRHWIRLSFSNINFIWVPIRWLCSWRWCLMIEATGVFP